MSSLYPEDPPELEEVPTEEHPILHEVIVKDMVNFAFLIQKSKEVKPSGPVKEDDDG